MFERLAELAREKLYLESSIHISANNEFIIEGCRRIEEYNEVYMRFLADGIYISIHGSGLRAFDFRTGGLVVRGCITKIEFEERNRKHETETLREDKRTGEGAL